MHARPGLKSLVPRYVHTYVQYVNCEVRMYVCTNNEELLKSYTLNNHTHLHPPQAPCTYTHYRPHPLTHTTGPTHLHTLQDLPTYAHYRLTPVCISGEGSSHLKAAVMCVRQSIKQSNRNVGKVFSPCLAGIE